MQPKPKQAELAIVETEPAIDLVWMQQRRERREQRKTILDEFYANLYDPEVGRQEKERWAMEWDRQRDLWLAQQASQHTRLAYARALQEWRAYLYEAHALAYPWMCEAEHVQGWIQYMSETGSALADEPTPLKPASICQRLAAASAYYSYIESCTRLVDGQQIGLFVTGDGYPRRNPFLSKQLKRPKTTPYSESRAIPTAAMQWILRQLGDKTNKTIADRRDYALLLLFYRTGYRADSALTMRWQDIEEAADGAGATHDWTGKRGKRKKKALPVRVYHALVAYLKADGRYAPGMAHHIQPEEYIWRPIRVHGCANFGVATLDANRHITQSTATEILRRHLRRYFAMQLEKRGYSASAASAEAATQAERYHLHSLRHSFAGELSAASQDNILLVQELLDHESAETTRIYIGAIKRPVDKATALLEQQFGI